MKNKNNTSCSAERWEVCKFIKSDGTIEVYENYMVSDQGKVCSITNCMEDKRTSMKILKQYPCNRLGHMSVRLYVNGKQYCRCTHRLMMSSFLSEQYFEGAEVDHIDRDPANNLLDNLHWVSRNENYMNRDKCPLKRIRVTYLSNMHVEIFDNMYDCSRAFGKGMHWCRNIISRFKGYNKKYNILIETLSYRSIDIITSSC